MKKNRIVTAVAAVGLTAAVVAPNVACDVFGARRTCTEYRMEAFGESYATAYRICSDIWPLSLSMP